MNPILPIAVCVPVPLAGDRLRGRGQVVPRVARREPKLARQKPQLACQKPQLARQKPQLACRKPQLARLLANKTRLIAAVSAAPFRCFFPHLRLF